MHIYSFKGGKRFEPDYYKENGEGVLQYQIFVEPKGRARLVERGILDIFRSPGYTYKDFWSTLSFYNQIASAID